VLDPLAHFVTSIGNESAVRAALEPGRASYARCWPGCACCNSPGRSGCCATTSTRTRRTCTWASGSASRRRGRPWSGRPSRQLSSPQRTRRV
jgi:hypothetical protein